VRGQGVACGEIEVEHFVRALDEQFFTLLRQEFSDAEIVELAHVAAMGVGFERFIAVWAPRVCAL